MRVMIERKYEDRLRQLLRQFPAVTVLGPRQCGKTTFIRRALPEWTYLDLERPSDVAPLAADPEARLAQLGDHVVFDEAQRLPDLFPVLLPWHLIKASLLFRPSKVSISVPYHRGE